MFYLDRRHDLAVAQIPKAGLNTIREWLNGAEVVDNREALAASTRVAFIRHPFARLASAYRFFYWLNYEGIRHDCLAPTHSWQAFVDYALRRDDGHWRPQWRHVGAVPNVYHRFEELGQHWQRYRGGFLNHTNRTASVAIDPDYRRADVDAFYERDLELWEAAA